MAIDLWKTLDGMKGRWMIGRSALEGTPASWRAVAEDDPNPDLTLLALAAQAMQFALRATPGGELKPLPPLPRLGHPTPPPEARRQFRKLVQVSKLPESEVAAVVHLLAARGFVVHPTDYMPKSFQQLPDTYAPWASWQRCEEVGNESPDVHAISADNWDDWMPAERRAALSLLRQRQPDVARELVADKAPSLPAQERVRIIEAMGDTLSAGDQSLLERFKTDRSGKVRQVVVHYLARLGAVDDEASDVSEFADFFSVAKKRLGRGCKITANRLKTKAQHNRRAELAGKLSFRSFVQGLNLDTEVELLSGWKHVDVEASEELVRMVAATGNEEAAAALASRLTSLDGISAEAFQLLFDRLGRGSRRALLPRVLEHDDAGFSAAVMCAEGLWGEVPYEELKSLRALKELKKLAGEDHSKKTIREETLRQGLFSLGLLVDRAAAEELLKLFTDTGLFASDPMLGLLKLNACLPLAPLKG